MSLIEGSLLLISNISDSDNRKLLHLTKLGPCESDKKILLRYCVFGNIDIVPYSENIRGSNPKLCYTNIKMSEYIDFTET